MKVLVVANYNKGHYAPFVEEQVTALKQIDPSIQIEWFGLKGHGIGGYLKNLPALKHKIADFHPNIIHAHYGLCGLIANLQRNTPVITTYHGSDINDKKIRIFSFLSILFSSHNIFVAKKLKPLWVCRKKASVIPCGVSLEEFPMIDKNEARKSMGLDSDKKYVLFASAFDNEVKNPQLAKKAMALLPNVQLLELKGYSRGQVNLLLHAVDVLLMTSHSEGSPQVIKEAMVCGCPIVSVDVGDVKNILNSIQGCQIVLQDPQEIASAVQSTSTVQRTDGLKRIIDLGLDNTTIVNQIIHIYHQNRK